ncbi:hypothetical protein Syun_025479 [Stephania yunnanensis]|uniref:Uncharacterized protein n=1 Tax=Stephania yunnanensis TaxID=152371 RepID=A0AAP0ES89_9MAGN
MNIWNKKTLELIGENFGGLLEIDESTRTHSHLEKAIIKVKGSKTEFFPERISFPCWDDSVILRIEHWKFADCQTGKPNFDEVTRIVPEQVDSSDSEFESIEGQIEADYFTEADWLGPVEEMLDEALVADNDQIIDMEVASINELITEFAAEGQMLSSSDGQGDDRNTHQGGNHQFSHIAPEHRATKQEETNGVQDLGAENGSSQH